MEYQNKIMIYLEEIDRLNKIVKDLEQDVADFKLKLSSMVNQ